MQFTNDCVGHLSVYCLDRQNPYTKTLILKMSIILFYDYKNNKHTNSKVNKVFSIVCILFPIRHVVRGLFKKFVDCLNCAALICSRCIRLVSLGSQRSADYDAIFCVQISLFWCWLCSVRLRLP